MSSPGRPGPNDGAALRRAIIVATLLMVPMLLLHGGVLFAGALQAHRIAPSGCSQRSGDASICPARRGREDADWPRPHMRLCPTACAAGSLSHWVGNHDPRVGVRVCPPALLPAHRSRSRRSPRWPASMSTPCAARSATGTSKHSGGSARPSTRSTPTHSSAGPYGERVAPRAHPADVPAPRSTAATAAGSLARLQAIERGEAA
jgi:hypothetical protein